MKVDVGQRRSFMYSSVKLSAVAIAMLGGPRVSAQTRSSDAMLDVGILNVALGLENEAIAAYQIGAQSNLLLKPTLDLAVKFQADHKAHRDALISAISKLGGKPIPDRKMEEHEKALGASALKTQKDVLTLAAKLELGAINAYVGLVPSFKDRELAKVAGSLVADETLHWALLNNALGLPLPKSALSFGL